MSRFILGLDLGHSRDYSALAAYVARRVLPVTPFEYICVEKRIFPRSRGLW